MKDFESGKLLLIRLKISRELWTDYGHRRSIIFPGGESNKDARARGVDAFQDILASYPGKRIAIGTHGNLMALTMGHYDIQFDYTFWKQLAMPAIWKLTFDKQQYIHAEPLSIQK
nr:histidine phosphatase family protein [Terribacillus saccharophilus]